MKVILDVAASATSTGLGSSSSSGNYNRLLQLLAVVSILRITTSSPNMLTEAFQIPTVVPFNVRQRQQLSQQECTSCRIKISIPTKNFFTPKNRSSSTPTQLYQSIFPTWDFNKKNKKKQATEIDIDAAPSKRRDVLKAAAAAAATTAAASRPGTATAATTGTTEISSTTKNLIADIPMIRIQLLTDGVGREYVAIQLKIQDQGPFDFMIDTGLTTEMITPHLQQTLQLASSNRKRQGFGAGGGTYNELIEVHGASLCCGTFPGVHNSDNTLQLPVLNAVVTDFPQEHIDPKHNIEGMIGMELLEQYDIDFDFANERFRLWKPGTCTLKSMNDPSLVEIPAVTINETGLIGIRITSATNPKQPIIGFLDCGSTFSVVNWLGAQYLGLPSKNDPIYNTGIKILAIGIDGKPLQLPTIPTKLSFAGDILKDNKTGKPIGFESAPAGWQPWDEVNLAIGDLPAFASLLSLDGSKPYTGPAALIGLDILSQRRIILGAQNPNGSRKRRVLVG